MSNSFERGPLFGSIEKSESEKTGLLEGFKKKTEPVSEAEIRRVYEHGTGFGSNNRKYRMGVKDNKPFFQVKYVGKLPDSLTGEQKSKFIWEPKEISGETKDVYTVKFGPVRQRESSEDKPYSITGPLRPKWELQENQKITVKQLAEEIKGKKVIFYTGAGISKASEIPDLNGLMKEMGINIEKDEDDLLRDCVDDPQGVADKWMEIKRKMAESPPTKAHESLTRIAERLDAPVLTENIDILHERAGTEAYHVNEGWLVEDIKPKDLKEVDAVITIGLGRDDNKLLAEYKKNNPNGGIVAINKRQEKPPHYPRYLGEKDLVVDGDLQEVVPQLEKELNKEGKPDVLYHAVPYTEQEEIIEEFEPVSRHRDYEDPMVFAATNKAAATMFLAKSKDDWTAKSKFDDVYVMVISDKERWKKVDKGGRIYALPSDTFTSDESKGWGRNEWVSHEPVRPIAGKTEEYSSVLDAMIDNGVQVYFVDEEKFKEVHEANDNGLEYLKTIQSENQKRGKNILPLEDKQ